MNKIKLVVALVTALAVPNTYAAPVSKIHPSNRFTASTCHGAWGADNHKKNYDMDSSWGRMIYYNDVNKFGFGIEKMYENESIAILEEVDSWEDGTCYAVEVTKSGGDKAKRVIWVITG